MTEHASHATHWRRLRAWFAGLLLISALIVVVTHYGELGHFADLLRQAEPDWLLAALLLQVGTYASTAVVWYVALRRTDADLPFLPLVPLSVAKVFSDHAMPSAGMSGTAFFIAALNRRGVPATACMAALICSLIGYYGAYLPAAAVGVLLLWQQHVVRPWVVAVFVAFCIVAVGVPAFVLWLRRHGSRRLPAWLLRFPGVHDATRAIAHISGELLRDPALITVTVTFHAAVFVFDAATLWVMLEMLGMEASFATAYASFMLASMVMTIGPIPLGLGTFEVACVTMLGLLGVPIEAGLTATLLLRGFTVWLPMLPGVWLAHRELR